MVEKQSDLVFVNQALEKYIGGISNEFSLEELTEIVEDLDKRIKKCEKKLRRSKFKLQRSEEIEIARAGAVGLGGVATGTALYVDASSLVGPIISIASVLVGFYMLSNNKLGRLRNVYLSKKISKENDKLDDLERLRNSCNEELHKVLYLKELSELNEEIALEISHEYTDSQIVEEPLGKNIKGYRIKDAS